MRAFSLLVTLGAVCAVQVPLAPLDLEFDAPEQQLASISAAGFTTLRVQDYPKHSVRIKRSDDFCDSSVRCAGLGFQPQA